MDGSGIASVAARPVSGIVLAAGPSTRFGTDSPKQLFPIEGEPLIRHIVRRVVASQLAEVIVVVGCAAEQVRLAIEDQSVSVVENPDFMSGQASSVKTGLAAVSSMAAAAMFVAVDQPRLSVTVIDALIACYSRTGGPIVVPKHGDRRGMPVLFDRNLFGELAEIEGDTGGRQLFRHHLDEIVELSLASAEPLEDIDTVDDLLRLGG